MKYFDRIIDGPFKNIIVFVDEEKCKMYLDCHYDQVYKCIIYETFYIRGEKCIYGLKLYTVNYTGNNSCEIDIEWKYFTGCYEPEIKNTCRLEYYSSTLEKLMGQDTVGLHTDTCNDYTLAVGKLKLSFKRDIVFSEKPDIDYIPYKSGLFIEYESGKNDKDIVRYVRAIDDLLRVLTFRRQIDKPFVLLYDEDHNKYMDFYFGNGDEYCPENETSVRIIHIEDITESIEVVFNAVLSNRPNTSFYVRYYTTNDHTKLFADTYGVFDKLSSKMYGKIKDPDKEVERVKNTIIEIIKNDDYYSDKKPLMDNLISKINTHGTAYGHWWRLKVAYHDLIRYIPNRTKMYNLEDDSFLENVYAIRTRIVHKGEEIIFKEEDLFGLEKLQWITYLMQLIEMGMTKEVDTLMDRVFGVG